MRVRVTPGAPWEASCRVPGDKSIAHRWLILAATARGRSALVGLPASLDVRSTASCLAAVFRKARPALEAVGSQRSVGRRGSRFHVEREGPAIGQEHHLRSRVRAVPALVEPDGPLDCGNSGTTMRLLAGIARRAHRSASVLTGDASLRTRPMERVAEPLCARWARGRDHRTGTRRSTSTVAASLRHPRYEASRADRAGEDRDPAGGAGCDGETTVIEPVATRDHTERALRALGAPVILEGSDGHVSRFQQTAFEARGPGDRRRRRSSWPRPRSPARRSRSKASGLNPTPPALPRRDGAYGGADRDADRTRGAGRAGRRALGGARAGRCGRSRVAASEIASVIDEVPVLAMLAQHADGDRGSWARPSSA